MRRVLTVAAWNLGLAVLLVALLEGLARWAEGEAPRPLFDQPDRTIRERAFVIRHPERRLALRPGYSVPEIHINSAGFRGSELPPPRDGRPMVLALGDSTTFGWRVADADTWPHQLQQVLVDAGKAQVRVVNAGVPSYTSAQTLLYLRELLPLLRPQVVLVSVLWNDVWHSTLDPWFPEALVRGQPTPWMGWLYQRSALLRWRMQGSGAEVDVLNPRALDHYRDNLEAMVDACLASGAKLAFLLPPIDLAHVDESKGPQSSPIGQGFFTRDFVLEIGRRYAAALAQVASRPGVAAIDHRLSIRFPRQPRLFFDLIHPRPRGNRMIAEDVGRFLLDRGWV